MYQPPPHHPHPPPPTPPGGSRSFQVGIGGAIFLVVLGVFATFGRMYLRKNRADTAVKKATLPVVGSHGTLANAPADASLCAVPKGGFYGWPCSKSKAQAVPRESEVRLMKAGVHRSDAVCRYWVQSGPAADASGDAPCEWFVAQ